jgi:hypothetical protein
VGTGSLARFELKTEGIECPQCQPDLSRGLAGFNFDDPLTRNSHPARETSLIDPECDPARANSSPKIRGSTDYHPTSLRLQ